MPPRSTGRGPREAAGGGGSGGAPRTPRPLAPPALRPGEAAVDPLEADDWAQDALDTLDEDDAVVAALTGPLWDKYVRNFHHYVADVIEGWAMEGRTFPSAAAKKAAVGRLVLGTRAEVAKDPRGWVARHCDRDR